MSNEKITDKISLKMQYHTLISYFETNFTP